MSKSLIYLDNNATTRVDPRVLEEMLPYFSHDYGNAASKSHRYGWTAQEAVDQARKKVAQCLGAKAKEIVFTSGATESDNLAVLGVARANGHVEAGPTMATDTVDSTNRRRRKRHLITSKIEHKAVLDAMAQLEEEGFAVTYLTPCKDGRVTPEQVAEVICEDSLLCSVMLVNNEVGAVNDVAAIAAVCKERGVLFHCDAVQGIGKVPFDVEEMGIDLASLSAHKIYGPKGIGALYVRRRPRIKISPILRGGGHERGMRSGTLNVPGIVGLGVACSLCDQEGTNETRRIRQLRDALMGRLRSSLIGVEVNGDLATAVAGTLNVSFACVEAEALLLKLSAVLAASTGSACTSATLEPSYVLTAMGVGRDRAHSAIRFSLGRFTSSEEIDRAGDEIIAAVQALRADSTLWQTRQSSLSFGGVGDGD